MKKIIEKLKDILYDGFDYVVMLGIVVAVVAVIGWRLDILFASDAKDIPGTTIHTAVDTPNKDNDKDVATGEKPDPSETAEEPAEEPTEETPVEEPVETPEDPATEVPPVVEDPPVSEPQAPAQASGEKVKIEIPAGSLPGKIGAILQEAGIISSSRDFLAKAVELKLDTKLKAGTYYIAKGSSYEEILKILSK